MWHVILCGSSFSAYGIAGTNNCRRELSRHMQVHVVSCTDLHAMQLLRHAVLYVT